MGLRIGVVTGSVGEEHGGAWTFSAALTGALPAVKTRHVFVNLDSVWQAEKPIARRLGFRAVANKAIALAQKPLMQSGHGAVSILEPPGPFRRLESLAQSEHADIVWFMNPAVWFMSPITGPLAIPYIVTVWDLEHRKQPYFPEVSTTGVTYSTRESVYATLLPRASLIVTGTEVGKDEVVRYYHVNPANVEVIPLPAPNGALLAQSSDGAEVRDKYGLSGGFLLYPAQFWPHKNHVNLVRALRLLRDEEELDLGLVLTGSDMGNLDHVKQEVVQLGLSDSVHLLGFVPRHDLTALYRASTGLVFPSFFGPDNLPPLEAFALGVPVIAADVAGAKEQLGEAALFFDPTDPSDMAIKIAELCRTPGLRDQLIWRGREIIKTRTPEAYITALCSCLDRFEAIRRCWGSDYQHP